MASELWEVGLGAWKGNAWRMRQACACDRCERELRSVDAMSGDAAPGTAMPDVAWNITARAVAGYALRLPNLRVE